MKNIKIILGFVVLSLFFVGCQTESITEESAELEREIQEQHNDSAVQVRETANIQTIRIEDNESVTLVTTDRRDNTVTFEMTILVESMEEDDYQFFDSTEMAEWMYQAACGIMQTSFFDRDEFENLLQSWDEDDVEIEVEDSTDQDVIWNLLSDKEIISVDVSWVGMDTRAPKARCLINGIEESDQELTIY